MTNVKMAISKAKTALVIQYPFFGALIMNTPIVNVKDVATGMLQYAVPTMGVDGVNIYYNEEYLKTKTVNEIMFIFAHEITHCALKHVWRCGARDLKTWNDAVDYITNDLLVKEGIGVMPKEGLLNPELVAQGEGLAEKVYELLYKNRSRTPTDGNNGGNNDGENPYAGTGIDICAPNKDKSGGADNAQIQQDWGLKVQQALNAAKMQGKLSANLERFIGEALKAKVDWREVLRRFVSKRAKIDYTWARPKRRMLGLDMYLPSLGGMSMGTLVVAVDCSGSINNQQLTEFGAEISAIVEDVKPASTVVLYFDSQICGEPQVFHPGDTVKLEPRGGGGTAFWPIFKYVEESEINPVCCVFLTDLMGDFGKDIPDYPVLWVVNHAGPVNYPFGERVDMA